ncbi:MAG: hypothetical protein HKN51_04675, partial [Saprospiraceae bacterium]|nr:hypothetical protein [Saprospiraceae bacterium]
MERFRFIFLALITIIIFSMCQDDVLNDSELDKQISDLAKDFQGRNNYNLVDSMLIPPNETQLNDLWQDMMLKANVNEIGGFLYENGLFNWEYAHLLKQYSHDEYIISIPTIHNDSIYSILYAGKVAGTYNYWHVSLDDLMLPTDDLINNLGMDNALTSIFSFLNYEQNIGDYNHKFLFRHLLDERFANKISEIELRGWCLLEVVLYHNDIESSQDDPCPCYYYNKLTGHQMFGVPKNFDPAKDDPTWIDWHPAQEYLYSITPTGVGTGSIIHGQDIEEEGYTVYHFWAWCPDDISQDPWQYNWVTNTQTITGGGDLPTGSHWDYDYGRWTEDVKDCMFAFDDPRFTEKINKVESDLITSSCGEAVAFNIKLIIDQLLLRLCETYYENLDGSEGGPPSNIGYGFDETVTSIMTEIDKSVHFEIGQRICDVCGETNDPEACIEDMDSCPPEAYEACVEDKLCDYAIGNFEIDNEILLDQEAKDLIKSKVSSCGSEGFEEEVLDILFTEYFSRIKSDKILDLEELFEDCFGEPNEFGDYIDCENSGNSIFEFTLYADQPVENSR